MKPVKDPLINYELAPTSALSPGLAADVPPLEYRRDLYGGARVRVALRQLLPNGAQDVICPLVHIVERTPTGYVAEVVPDKVVWLPIDSRLIVTAESIAVVETE